MKEVLLTILRDKNTDIEKFRRTSEKLAYLLAQEASDYLEKENIKIQTPLCEADGVKIKNDIILIPILRSAIALLQPFLTFFQKAKVGFLGLKRDEKTAVANMYYKNFPNFSKNDDVIILDPMIATGGSGEKAIEILKKEGVLEEKIIFVAVITSYSGVTRLKNKFPKIKLFYVQEDKELNKNKFIIPGLGDFGDRYFGTF
ncbi:uracil phosphoribosyltransferase [Candidatus Dependentiae bacterium]